MIKLQYRVTFDKAYAEKDVLVILQKIVEMADGGMATWRHGTKSDAQ